MQDKVAVEPDAAVVMQQVGTDEVGPVRGAELVDRNVAVGLPERVELGAVEHAGRRMVAPDGLDAELDVRRHRALPVLPDVQLGHAGSAAAAGRRRTSIMLPTRRTASSHPVARSSFTNASPDTRWLGNRCPRRVPKLLAGLAPQQNHGIRAPHLGVPAARQQLVDERVHSGVVVGVVVEGDVAARVEPRLKVTEVARHVGIVV